MKIKVGIVGYGNVGKSVEKEVKKIKDIELVGIFTRRNTNQITSSSNVYNIQDIQKFIGKIDVLILCLGSSKDLVKYAYNLAKNFNTIDCYDMHSKIFEYYKHINKINKKAKTVSLVAAGWNPGIFSQARLMFDSILPTNNTYTFLGSGVSLSHAEAIKGLVNVKNAIQYTYPKKDAISKVKEGIKVKFKENDMHSYECYVVLNEDTPESRKIVEKQIKSMPNYFADNETIVNFISEEEFEKNHSKLLQSGVITCSAITGENNKQSLELSVKLESNPEFTASILLAYTRAVYKLASKDEHGSYTIFDIPVNYISNKKVEDVFKKLL